AATTPRQSSPTPSSSAKSSTRRATSSGRGRRRSSSSTIVCTRRLREAWSRRARGSATVLCEIGSRWDRSPSSSRSAVRAWARPRRTTPWSGVRPPSGAQAVAKGRAATRASAASGLERSASSSLGKGTGTREKLEVDHPLDALGDLVQVVGPGAGRQVLPPAVADDEHAHALVDALGDPDGAGEGGAGRDPGEDPALVGQAAGVLDRLAGAHDAPALPAPGAAPLLVHRRDVALVEAAQALDGLAHRRLDGQDLDGGVLLLEEGAHTEQRAAGAQAGDEVGHLGA